MLKRSTYILSVIRAASSEAAILENKLGVTKRIEENEKPEGWYEAKPLEEIPGPKPLPLIGNLWRYFPIVGDFYGLKQHEMYNRLYEQYGEISCLKGIPGIKPYVLLYNPDAIEANSCKPNVIFRSGKPWHDFRTVVNPIMMQPKVVKQYVNVIDKTADDFLEKIRYLAKNNPKGEMPEDFLNEIYKFTFESIALIAMDKRFGALDLDPEKSKEAEYIISLITELFQLLYKLDIRPSLWKWLSTPNWRRFVEINDTIEKVFTGYIDKEAEKLKQGEKRSAPDQEMSVFEKLLAIDKEVALLTTMDMLGAGIDTTGRVIGSGLYFLAKNKEAQSKLREELISLLPLKSDHISANILDKAQYLKATLKEIMRLAPIGAVNMRTNTKDLVLCGYQIPKGTELLSMNLTLSTATDKYFPKANQFIPERWLRETKGELSYKNVNPFLSLPFGFGPRSCIGRRFAQLEMETILAKIIRNFELDWKHKDMEFDTMLVYGIAEPLKITVKEV
ncbi:cytochrome p450 [Rhyzopertha dominica]|nr:cytochrome p450 [Rhyzopertha dominica]